MDDTSSEQFSMYVASILGAERCFIAQVVMVMANRDYLEICPEKLRPHSNSHLARDTLRAATVTIQRLIERTIMSLPYQ